MKTEREYRGTNYLVEGRHRLLKYPCRSSQHECIIIIHVNAPGRARYSIRVGGEPRLHTWRNSLTPNLRVTGRCRETLLYRGHGNAPLRTKSSYWLNGDNCCRYCQTLDSASAQIGSCQKRFGRQVNRDGFQRSHPKGWIRA